MEEMILFQHEKERKGHLNKKYKNKSYSSKFLCLLIYDAWRNFKAAREIFSLLQVRSEARHTM